MRRIVAASLIAVGGMLAGAPAQAFLERAAVQGQRHRRHHRLSAGAAGRYPPLADRSLRPYGKVVRFLGVQPNYGGYVSFACRWVPYGAAGRPLRTYY